MTGYPQRLRDEDLLLALQEFSDKDGELFHESESDVDVHLEQSDSESVEDPDEDDASN